MKDVTCPWNMISTLLLSILLRFHICGGAVANPIVYIFDKGLYLNSKELKCVPFSFTERDPSPIYVPCNYQNQRFAMDDKSSNYYQGMKFNEDADYFIIKPVKCSRQEFFNDPRCFERSNLKKYYRMKRSIGDEDFYDTSPDVEDNKDNFEHFSSPLSNSRDNDKQNKLLTEIQVQKSWTQVIHHTSNKDNRQPYSDIAEEIPISNNQINHQQNVDPVNVYDSPTINQDRYSYEPGSYPYNPEMKSNDYLVQVNENVSPSTNQYPSSQDPERYPGNAKKKENYYSSLEAQNQIYDKQSDHIRDLTFKKYRNLGMNIHLPGVNNNEVIGHPSLVHNVDYNEKSNIRAQTNDDSLITNIPDSRGDAGRTKQKDKYHGTIGATYQNNQGNPSQRSSTRKNIYASLEAQNQIYDKQSDKARDHTFKNHNKMGINLHLSGNINNEVSRAQNNDDSLKTNIPNTRDDAGRTKQKDHYHGRVGASYENNQRNPSGWSSVKENDPSSLEAQNKIYEQQSGPVRDHTYENHHMLGINLHLSGNNNNEVSRAQNNDDSLKTNSRDDAGRTKPKDKYHSTLSATFGHNQQASNDKSQYTDKKWSKPTREPQDNRNYGRGLFGLSLSTGLF